MKFELGSTDPILAQGLADIYPRAKPPAAGPPVFTDWLLVFWKSGILFIVALVGNMASRYFSDSVLKRQVFEGVVIG